MNLTSAPPYSLPLAHLRELRECFVIEALKGLRSPMFEDEPTGRAILKRMNHDDAKAACDATRAQAASCVAQPVAR